MSSIPQIILKWIGRDLLVCIAPAVGFAGLGAYFDRSETLAMTRFRDRSALYGRPPPPEGETEVPSWPTWG